ncbi:hypothetical protein G647_00197 [Cladophialophora carrionii CBS 160.54]|uniref:Xylanolytic transcriptional activator regulatory domain-containing protein n=1 Tax=Cladophialophora carrionii CBS 160.54 TaxID=1279043 RepID=V9DN53_9EURO|nr:uncharacterized protein G647_00197 [Cladophialophora carrionii CBS 160.54]ETI27748.1 hypothetical protein G647_00197 [Cladophialophora carrionii CBS 160.54]
MDAVGEIWDSVLGDPDLDLFGWDLSRAPNDNYFMLDSLDSEVVADDVPQDSGDTAALDACILSFKQHDLPCLPCIPARQQNHPREIQYSMAALGALHVDQYKCLARIFHDKAVRALETSAPHLSRLQSQLLSIEFAVWSRDEDRRRWAICEISKAAFVSSQIALAEFPIYKIAPDLPEYDILEDREEWFQKETYKRTIFGLYVTCTLASNFVDINVPISSQHVRLPLPCDADVWEASSEEEWEDAVRKKPPEANFQEAIHTLLKADVWHDCGLETASTFSQCICLCGFLETMWLERRLPTNYVTARGWHNQNMNAFSRQRNILQALDMCRSLWWTSTGVAYLFVSLNDGEVRRAENPQNYHAALQAAAEVFASCSKADFLNVSKTCRATISRPGRHCAVHCARLLRKWADHIDTSGPQQILEREDSMIQLQVCQAVKRGRRQGIMVDSNPDKLTPAVIHMWSMMLGGEDWI